MHSKTTTAQHQQASEQHAQARAIPGTREGGFGGSSLGLFSKPAVNKEEVMLDAARYLEHVSSPKNKLGFVEKSKHVLSVAGHEIYDHPILFALDASPLGSLDSAQGIFTGHSFIHGGDLNRGWAAVGALPVLGVAAKYGRPLVSGAVAGLGKTYSEAKGFFGGNLGYDGYRYNMVTNPGPLSKLEGRPALNFSGGKYNKRKLDSDLILSRVGQSGGGRNTWGQWFTAEPTNSIAHARMDLAIKPIWKDVEGTVVGKSPIDAYYNLRIPKGAVVYEGPVGYQKDLHLGGQDIMQIYIHKPWELRKAEVLNEVLIRGPQ